MFHQELHFKKKRHAFHFILFTTLTCSSSSFGQKEANPKFNIFISAQLLDSSDKKNLRLK